MRRDHENIHIKVTGMSPDAEEECLQMESHPHRHASEGAKAETVMNLGYR